MTRFQALRVKMMFFLLVFFYVCIYLTRSKTFMKREEVKGRCKKDRATQIKMKFQIKD